MLFKEVEAVEEGEDKDKEELITKTVSIPPLITDLASGNLMYQRAIQFHRPLQKSNRLFKSLKVKHFSCKNLKKTFSTYHRFTVKKQEKDLSDGEIQSDTEDATPIPSTNGLASLMGAYASDSDSGDDKKPGNIGLLQYLQ